MKRFAAHGPIIEDAEHGGYVRLEDAQAEIERLRALVNNQVVKADEQAIKDAERMDWLRSNWACACEFQMPLQRAIGLTSEAIDAAMREGEEWKS